MTDHNNHSGKKKVAILIEHAVEDAEFTVPYNGLKQAGMEVVVLGSRMNEKYKGKRGKLSIQADGTTTEAIAKESDNEVNSVFQEIIANKQRHIQKLETYLQLLGEKPSLGANIANQYAKVKTAMTGSDDIYQLRSALGDVQTGIGDIGNLSAMFTDPVATAIFKEIYHDLLKYEQRLAQLYRARIGGQIQPPKPTTGAAVSI